jgi:hypothetical protein
VKSSRKLSTVVTPGSVVTVTGWLFTAPVPDATGA